MHTCSLDASIGATRLAVAVGVERLTDLAMLIAPFIVTQLLLGGDILPVAVGLVRLGGAALLSPGQQVSSLELESSAGHQDVSTPCLVKRLYT